MFCKAAVRSLLLLLLVATGGAEDESGSDSSNVDADGNYYNTFSVCDDSVIVVQDLSILCDSPGTYYYGSNKYRNSATCKSGDKAKVDMTFQITKDLTDYYTPYLTMTVTGYGTIQSTTLYDEESLCDISSNVLTSQSGNTYGGCPAAGYYRIKRSFTIGEQYDGYEYGYIPQVKVGFASAQNKNVYDLGGANTNKCAGDTFINWTKGVRKSAANTIKTFFATFGILLGAILAVFFAGWLIMRQSRHQPKEIVIDDDPLDEAEYQHKVSLVGQSGNALVDL